MHVKQKWRKSIVKSQHTQVTDQHVVKVHIYQKKFLKAHLFHNAIVVIKKPTHRGNKNNYSFQWEFFPYLMPMEDILFCSFPNQCLWCCNASHHCHHCSHQFNCSAWSAGHKFHHNNQILFHCTKIKDLYITTLKS